MTDSKSTLRRVGAVGESVSHVLPRAGGLLVILFLCAPIAAAVPHEKNQSYVLFEFREGRINGEFQATLKDLNAALDLGFRTDGTATREDVRARMPNLVAYFEDRVQFIVGDTRLRVDYTDVDIMDADFGQFAILDFTFPDLTQRPEQIRITYAALFESGSDHTGLAAIMYDWESGVFDEPYIALVFTPNQQEQVLDLASTSVWRGFAAIVKLGTIHIWQGTDHIFFLIALILPAVVRRRDSNWEPVSSFKPAFVYVIKIVTLFTLAHSVTLSLAALGLLKLSPRLVESVIAASILAAAVDILVPVFGKRIWLIVFGFGLFHGFGFAGALADMGLTGEYAGLTLFGFNVGVELGQVIIISAVFPVLFAIRKWPTYNLFVLRGGAVALSAIATVWLFERLFDINVPLGAYARKLVGILV